MYDSDTVKKARERDGSAGQDREDDVEDLLSWEQLGYDVGEPLAAERYEDYPDSVEQLSAPKWGDLLRELFSHPCIQGWEDAVQELTPAAKDRMIRQEWRDALRNAASAAQVGADALFSEGDPSDMGGPRKAFVTLTEDLSDHVTDEHNPLTLAYLYVEQGLSVEEVAALCEREEDAVRRALHDLGLVVRREDRPDGKTADEILVDAPDGEGRAAEDVRLGGINVDAVRGDPNVTVERE